MVPRNSYADNGTQKLICRQRYPETHTQTMVPRNSYPDNVTLEAHTQTIVSRCQKLKSSTENQWCCSFSGTYSLTDTGGVAVDTQQHTWSLDIKQLFPEITKVSQQHVPLQALMAVPSVRMFRPQPTSTGHSMACFRASPSLPCCPSSPASKLLAFSAHATFWSCILYSAKPTQHAAAFSCSQA